MSKCSNVSYNGSQLIPIQTVAINKSWIKTEDTQLIGSRYDITLEGTLVALKGSPRGSFSDTPGWSGYNNMYWQGANYPDDETGTINNQFDNLLNKTDALRRLFAEEGKLLEIQGADGTPPIKAPVKLVSLNFAPEPWIYKIPYTINLEADYLVGEFITGPGEDNFSQNLNSANESWNIEYNSPENKDQQYTYRVTHTVSANGRRYYELDGSLRREGWQEAQEWVESRLGFDINQVSFSGTQSINSQNLSAWNHLRLVNKDKTAGNYSVTESWILATGCAIEDFTVSSNTSVSDGLYRVNIDGSVQGLESTSFTQTGVFATQTKWFSASGYFGGIVNQLYERAYGYANANGFSRPLNPIPLTTQVNRNPVAGIINYSYAYDTRRGLCLTGINVLSEDIQITDDNPVDVFAVIPILGRASGPIIQNINTQTEYKRGMTVQLTLLPATGCIASSPVQSQNVIIQKVQRFLSQSPYRDVKVFFEAMDLYLRAAYPQVKVSQDSEQWSPYAGSYSRQVQWTIGLCTGNVI